MHPNKTDVLNYLDNAGPAPTRFAHVVLSHRASEEPTYEDILVGPIDASGVRNGTTTWEPLDYPYTRKTAGRVRNLDADSDGTLYSQWIYKISATISDITLDLWQGTALDHDNDTLSIWGIDPLWQDDGRIVRWDAFWSNPVDEFDTQVSDEDKSCRNLTRAPTLSLQKSRAAFHYIKAQWCPDLRFIERERRVYRFSLDTILLLETIVHCYSENAALNSHIRGGIACHIMH